MHPLGRVAVLKSHVVLELLVGVKTVFQHIDYRHFLRVIVHHEIFGALVIGVHKERTGLRNEATAHFEFVFFFVRALRNVL